MTKTPEQLHRALAGAFKAEGWVDDGTAILAIVKAAEAGRVELADVCQAVSSQSLLNIGISREDLARLLVPMDLAVVPSPKDAGRTVVLGDVVRGNKVSGSTVHGPIIAAETITDSFNNATADMPAELNELLTDLQQVVKELCACLPDEAALGVSRDLDAFTQEVTAPSPRRARFSVTGQGLIEAATSVVALSPAIVKLVESVTKLVS